MIKEKYSSEVIDYAASLLKDWLKIYPSANDFMENELLSSGYLISQTDGIDVLDSTSENETVSEQLLDYLTYNVPSEELTENKLLDILDDFFANAVIAYILEDDEIVVYNRK